MLNKSIKSGGKRNPKAKTHFYFPFHISNSKNGNKYILER